MPTATGPQPDHDARWEAMIPVLDGKLPRVHRRRRRAADPGGPGLCRDTKDCKLVLVGGYDAAECVPLLKKHDVPVIVGGVHRLPARRDEAYDARSRCPSGCGPRACTFCIARRDGRRVRIAAVERPQPALPRGHGGRLRSAGRRSAQERSRSTRPQILGVADRIGSLEAGKDATLIVTDRRPRWKSPPKSPRPTSRAAPRRLKDRHKRLWEKYKEKYRRLGIEELSVSRAKLSAASRDAVNYSHGLDARRLRSDSKRPAIGCASVDTSKFRRAKPTTPGRRLIRGPTRRAESPRPRSCRRRPSRRRRDARRRRTDTARRPACDGRPSRPRGAARKAAPGSSPLERCCRR